MASSDRQEAVESLDELVGVGRDAEDKLAQVAALDLERNAGMRGEFQPVWQGYDPELGDKAPWSGVFMREAGTELERSLQRASIEELRAELAAREGGAEGVPPEEGFVRHRVDAIDQMHAQ